ncbi:MAG: MoxR family ATPase [Deltaproteobacteria bacterium]|nr:MoxR family ATPase [Deltaproteobacteria bacterium]
MSENTQAATDVQALTQEIKAQSAFIDDVMREIGQVIVGQRAMIERILIGLLCEGHILLEGVPGLAKTLTLTTVAKALSLDFKRIQFTPDLLPADVTGTSIWDPDKRVFEPRLGPVFGNLILADEINRAPAKVQSALLEAMQERSVTIGNETFVLPRPYFVMATQNPLEQEGTYPLPEAQVDRFMLKVHVGYPTQAEERVIMERMTEPAPEPIEIRPVVGKSELLAAQKAIHSIYVDDKIKRYILNLVFATREPEKAGLKELEPLLHLGASPRASIALNMAARGHAFLRGRGFVTPDDVKAVGPEVLRHRLHLTFEAEAEEIQADDVVQKVFNAVPVP